MADPNSGRIVWTLTIATPSGGGGDWHVPACGYSGYGTAPYDLEIFSRNFHRVVAFSPSGHVGWVDTATGVLTDVTQMAPLPSPAFGQSPGKDSDPKFDPSDDSFWFGRVSVTGAASVMRLAVGGSRVQTVATANNYFGYSWVVSKAGALIDIAALAQSFETETNDVSIFGPVIEVNQKGSAAFSCSPHLGQCYVRSPLDAQWTAIAAADDLLTKGYYGPDWITDDQLIFYINSGEASVYVITLGATATVSTLIQPVSARYSGFAVGPDGKSLVFLASSASTSDTQALYKISLDGAGQPSPLPEGQGLTSLLAWR